jgi:serine phosphatase RsbU (regulator of sigma subunit)
VRESDAGWAAALHRMWTSVGRITARDELAQLIMPPLQALPGVVAVWGLRHAADDSVLEYRWTGVPLEGERRDLARAAAAGLTPPGLAALGFAQVVRDRFDLDGEAAGTILVAVDGTADVPMIRTCLGQVIEVTREAVRRLGQRRAEHAQQTRDALLAEASLQMDAVLDTIQTLRRIPRMAVPAIAEGCLVYVVEDGRAHLRGSVHVDMRRLAGLLGDPAVTAHLTDLVDGTLKGAVLPADSGLLATRAADVQPLLARGEVVGVMVFLFDRDDAAIPPAAFLRDLAARAALAIDNGSRYERRRRDVATMQQHLLPTRLPEIDGLEVAAAYLVGDRIIEVGGDFYDVVATADGSAAALIGDVCGRGVEAAALTGMARHTLAALLQEGATPTRAMTRLNARLRLDGSWRFVTAGVASMRLSADGVVVDWVSAGHPAPVVLRHAGPPDRGDGGGAPLGVLAVPSIAGSRLVLAAGDTLIIFTDGLTESRGPDGVMFEDHALEEALDRLRGRPIDELVRELAAASAAFGGARTDDIAVLAIRAGNCERGERHE